MAQLWSGGCLMFRMVYVSSAIKEFSKNDLVELLEVARRKNAAADITGLLLYKGGSFMQVLEGEKACVQALYRKISRDVRHDGCFILLEEEAEARIFEDWSMGFRDLDDPALSSLPGFSPFMNRPLTAGSFLQNPSDCMQLLSMFRRER